MSIQSEIAEKQRILRALYGGSMTQKELMKEVGCGARHTKEWAEKHNLGRRIGKRVSYDTDAVAKALIIEREFI